MKPSNFPATHRRTPYHSLLMWATRLLQFEAIGGRTAHQSFNQRATRGGPNGEIRVGGHGPALQCAVGGGRRRWPKIVVTRDPTGICLGSCASVSSFFFFFGFVFELLENKVKKEKLIIFFWGKKKGSHMKRANSFCLKSQLPPALHATEAS